ncbi:hypothetical protein BDR04DRAFT_1123167 [Suillus decipiens]|nr:hypothetical protein BDR04DRAFT_1123167 [Suillus decipiens]
MHMMCANKKAKSGDVAMAATIPAVTPATPPKTVSAKEEPWRLPAATGHAYLLNDETHQAIYVATPDPANLPTPSAEFAGLISNTNTPTFIHELLTEEEDEYTALAAVEALTTSLDWHLHIQPVDFTGLTYKAPNQCQNTTVDPSIIPLFLDSGASIHISNEESDFFSLHPIPPCFVNGVAMHTAALHYSMPLVAGFSPAMAITCYPAR